MVGVIIMLTLKRGVIVSVEALHGIQLRVTTSVDMHGEWLEATRGIHTNNLLDVSVRFVAIENAAVPERFLTQLFLVLT
jgi:hypothetical protein